MIERDYSLRPVKPTMDGEPRYEDHPVDWKPDQKGWFDEYDVRQAAYWGVFAGAHGTTYGCHPIWQMKTASREPVGLARHNWDEVLDLPGASQMRHVRALMESRPFLSRVPDQSLLASDPASGEDHARAARGDGYAFVYLPTGKPVSIHLGAIFSPLTARTSPSLDHGGAGLQPALTDESVCPTADLDRAFPNGQRPGKQIKAWWYDPRSGRFTLIATFAGRGAKEFTPPGKSGRGNDWVLVLDEADRKFPPPGARPS